MYDALGVALDLELDPGAEDEEGRLGVEGPPGDADEEGEGTGPEAGTEAEAAPEDAPEAAPEEAPEAAPEAAPGGAPAGGDADPAAAADPEPVVPSDSSSEEDSGAGPVGAVCETLEREKSTEM